ncbi:probable serine/threonine-protein kinase kinX [Palaemon carinicauda]|uniref:probable serine/threonine-protein kinase kinX n=1 Tax=Palaemon carinicauda TaxID=392227 RepID=UPI0035B657E0
MKWVLLLSLGVSLAYGRTIFDYERDGLDNKQEGLPGKSVTGQYEWRGPDGKVTEVSYIADHMGFRLLDDLELKPPTEPFRQAESTSKMNTKYSSDSSYSDQEEEEEEEEEGEENEIEEGEIEEEEQEEEGGEETSDAQEAEKSTGEETKTEAKTAEAEGAETAEAEGAETADANEKEADTTEKETQTNDATSKSLDPSDVTTKEVTTDDKVAKEKAFPESSNDSKPVAEERTGAVEGPSNDVPSLIPIKIESTFPEETTLVREPVFVEESSDTAVVEPVLVDETSGTVVVEPVFVDAAPVIATGEMTLPAEPFVAPIATDMFAFASKSLGPSEDVLNAAEPMSEIGVISDVPFSGVAEIPFADSANQQIMSSDNGNSPSAYPGPAFVVIGSFSDESQDPAHYFDNQNDFEREERTVAIVDPAQENIPEPSVQSAVELDYFNTALFPVAEPLQQPNAVEPSPIDVELSLDTEPVQQPLVEIEPVPADEPMPLFVSKALDSQFSPEIPVPSALENSTPELFLVEVPEISFAKNLDIQSQETQLVPVFELEVPQEPAKVMLDDIVEEIPLALPFQQVQTPETVDLSTSNVRSVENQLNADPMATVFVREIDLSRDDNKPALEIDIAKHRFDVTKAIHSMDSTPVLDESIPQIFQVPDPNPSQPEEPLNLEFVGVTFNEIEKPAAILGGQIFDSVNLIPLQDPSFIDIDSQIVQNNNVFVPEQGMLVEGPEMTNNFPVPVETPVAAPQTQEPAPVQPAERLVLSSPEESGAVSSQFDNTDVRIIEIPVDVETTDAEGVLLIRAAEPRRAEPMQGPPLLPPLMKVPRLLM